MTTPALEPPTLDDIRAAHARLGREVVRTPLVRLGIDGPAEIYLKLENLQPIGSFKLRGAANAMAHASDAELARGVFTASARLGGEVHKVPFAEWWNVLVTRQHPRFAGRLFIHPVSERAVFAGNGTIGLEIAEALPAPDAVIIPYGGGGLTTGIAAAMR